MSDLAHLLKATYSGKRVFLTGHTGFKGGWLTFWLSRLGAEVFGFALPPDTEPSLFESLDLNAHCHHVEGDLRRPEQLRRAFVDARPDFVFHLAAQPLVRRSYENPIETIETNVMGTSHLLEVLRTAHHPCAVVIATSDKCYENREWTYGYREADAMGGHDVYSMSKGVTELVVQSYRRSFFTVERLAEHGIAVATARAGNVIGGGDWARDRIVPDIVRAISSNKRVSIRNPQAVRPWQHVLEPLSGYLLLGAHLSSRDHRAASFAESWNFGPLPADARPVREVVKALIAQWGSGDWQEIPQPGAPHEASLLRLSIDKAVSRLGWTPRWRFQEALEKTAQWYRAHAARSTTDAMQSLTSSQIDTYMTEQAD